MSLGVLFPDWSQVVVASADNQVQLRDLQGDVEEYVEEYVADNNATVNNYEDEEEVALQNYLKALEEARFDGYLEVLGASFVSPVIGLRIDELEVHLWDVETSKVIKILRDPIEGIINVAFSPNGQLMATLSCASTIQLWDGKTLEAIGDRISKFSYSKVESDGLIFFSSDSQLLGANHHGCAAVMNVQERNQVWSFGKLGHISDLGFRLYAISHDNSKVAGVVNASEILVWDLDRTTRMRTGVRRSPPGYYTFTVGAFSPADSSFLAIARPTHVDIWQIDTEIRLLNQISLEEPIYGNISFSSDGQYLAYGPLCWDVLTSSPHPIPYSSDIPPASFRKAGFNTHSFLSYEEGWIHSLFPPRPVLPIPTELRMIELDKRWHISDERVFFIGKRGLPVFIDCSPILARARQE
ncbi:hypothetical protein FRC17_000093 [Serendipita sp. 399]|nr:hypothetical protein FRC17_000093 [Serendipita sp. 399]